MKTETELCTCGHCGHNWFNHLPDGRCGVGGVTSTGQDWHCSCSKYTPKGKEFNAYKNGDSTYNCGVFKEHENCHVKDCGCECHEKGKESAGANGEEGGKATLASRLGVKPRSSSTPAEPAPLTPLSENPAAIEAAARVIEQYYYKANGKYSTLISRDKAKQILLAAERAARQFDSKAVEAAEKATEGKQ